MSSHHFVIDGQEPALIVANGQSCSYELLVQLLEWCPFVVALDGAYNRLAELQIKPDLVVGDFDSIDSSVISDDVVFLQDKNQNNTDLQKAIDHLSTLGYSEINIVWATGKRLDHTINNLMTLAKYPKVKITLYDNYSKAFVVQSPFKKTYRQGDPISLIPLPICSGIKTNNLKYPLSVGSLELGKKSGTSNEAKTSGEVKITYESGLLAVIESKD